MFEADVGQGFDTIAAWAMIFVGNTTITILSQAGATVVISATGLALKVTQSTGVTQTVTGRLFKFGP
jgi:hypothetical protein